MGEFFVSFVGAFVGSGLAFFLMESFYVRKEWNKVTTTEINGKRVE